VSTITAAQLAECAYWRRSDSTPSLVRSKTGRQRPNETSSTTRTAPPPPTDIFPQASLPQRGPHAEPSVHSLSGTHRIHVTACPLDGGSQAVTLGGQWLRCLEAACVTCHCYGLSRHRPIPSRTPLRSYAALSTSTLSATRRPNFTQPQVVAGKRHPTSSSRMPRRVTRAERRGASSAARRPQPRLTMTATSTSK
jgi:hypothetical protein